jgi:serine/threonine protein kinase
MAQATVFQIDVDDVQYELKQTEGRPWAERKLLGDGTYSKVYAATYAHQPVAVKIVWAGTEALGPEDLSFFWREAGLQFGLRGPNIVVVYGAFIDTKSNPPEYGVVMQRMENSLHDLLYKNTSALPTLLKRLEIIYQVRSRFIIIPVDVHTQ